MKQRNPAIKDGNLLKVETNIYWSTQDYKKRLTGLDFKQGTAIYFDINRSYASLIYCHRNGKRKK